MFSAGSGPAVQTQAVAQPKVAIVSYALELATTPRGGGQRCANGAVRWVRRMLVFAALVCGFWLLGALLDGAHSSAAAPQQSPVRAGDSSQNAPLLGGLVAQLDTVTPKLATTVDQSAHTVHAVVHVVHHTVHSVVHDAVAPTVQRVARTAEATVKSTVQTVETVENALTNAGRSLPTPVSDPVAPVGQATSSKPQTVAAPKLSAGAGKTAAATRRQLLAGATWNTPSDSASSVGPRNSSGSRTPLATHRGAGVSEPLVPRPATPSVPVPAKGAIDPGTTDGSRSAQNDSYVLGSDAPRAVPGVVSRVRHEARTLPGATNSRPDVSPD